MKLSKFSPFARAIGVMGVTAGLVTGVTFAALNSTATLTDTSINTANAGLLLWNGSSFQPTAPGFTVTGQIPGTDSAPQAFYFQNSGDVAETVSVKLSHFPGTDLDQYSDIGLEFTCVGQIGGQVSTNVQALMDGAIPLNLTLPVGAQGDTGNPNAVGNCTVSFNLNPAGVNNDSAFVNDLDLNFTGSAVVAPVQ